MENAWEFSVSSKNLAVRFREQYFGLVLEQKNIALTINYLWTPPWLFWTASEYTLLIHQIIDVFVGY